MQLKQFYNIATKVSSRKSATTFGDLPDWLAMVFSNINKIHILALAKLTFWRRTGDKPFSEPMIAQFTVAQFIVSLNILRCWGYWKIPKNKKGT